MSGSLAPIELTELDWESIKNEKGIGTIVGKPDAKAIEGVRINPFPVFPDDRGYFLEVLRIGQGMGSEFPPERTQVSSALSYPGTIKAFHYHLLQTDLWVPVHGMLQVGLVDLRKKSPTYGVRNTLYVGELRPWQILIPPGVGHGYKVIGQGPAVLVYVTNQLYTGKDEGRIAHNHAGIAYDWELQHK